MGNKYSAIRIGSLVFPVFWAFPDDLMSLYQRGELVKSISYVERDTDEWYDMGGVRLDKDDHGARIIDELYLQAPASTLLNRLRLLRGATGALRTGFQGLVTDRITSLQERHRDSSKVEDEIANLNGYELSDYVRDLRSAMVSDDVTWAVTWANGGSPPDPSWLLDLIFSQERADDYATLFFDWLALVTEVAGDLPVIVDVLDLIADSPEEEAALRDIEEAYSRPSPDREHFSHAPLIVFTEGITDARWLGRAVSLLRPDITEFVRFFDYKASKVGGGASEVVRLVRALSEVGMQSQMLVLLDNDTAGLEAKLQLSGSSLRSNIRVRSLPPLELLRSYPTLGPGGLEELDVNGRAASIEFYFGEDVLRDDAGVLTPVQWTGWNRNVGQYQGELVDKRAVQKRIALKLDGREHASVEGDWSGIEKVFETLISSGDGPQIS